MRVENKGLFYNLNRYMDELNRTSRKISTGRAINTASDNPATTAIAEKMDAIIRELLKREGNVQDMVNMMQTAEGGLSNIGEILQRMRELAVQASNGTLTQEDRNQIQAEFEQLKEELNRISSNTRFNNKPLLDVNTEKLDLDKLDLTNPTQAEKAISRLDNAIKTISSDRGNLGAIINGYRARLSNYQVQRENTTASYSRIMDTDMAEAITKYNQFQTLSQISLQTIRKMNQLLKMKLNLLT